MHPRLERRLLLLAGAALLGAARSPLGVAVEVVGSARAERREGFRSLAAAVPLDEGDTLVTDAASRLLARLQGEVELRLGAQSRLRLDALGRSAPGTVLRHAAGPFWFARPAGAPSAPVAVVSSSLLIAVRGTAFWGGPLDGRFSVFVAHGLATVTAGNERVEIPAGMGSDIGPDGRPTPAVPWAWDRQARALATVGLTP